MFAVLQMSLNVVTAKRYHVYYHIIFTVPTVLPWNFPHTRGNYRGYRGITAFPTTVSSSTQYIYLKASELVAYDVLLFVDK